MGQQIAIIFNYSAISSVVINHVIIRVMLDAIHYEKIQLIEGLQWRVPKKLAGLHGHLDGDLFLSTLFQPIFTQAS